MVKKKQKTKTKSSIMSKVKPVSETEQRVSSLFYGRSGTGKTTLASTYPKKIILLDFSDKGTDSIKDVEGVDTLLMDKWEYVEDIYWSLVNEEHSYQTVVLDTITGMQNLVIKEVRESNNLDPDDSLSRRNWGEVAGMMNNWLMNYRDLDMHVVFLAMDRVENADDEESEYDEDQLDPEVGPSVTPSVARTINAAVNVLGNTYIRQQRKIQDGKTVLITEYRLRIGPHPYFITKIRSPKKFKVPSAISNPSYNKIVKIIKGES